MQSARRRSRLSALVSASVALATLLACGPDLPSDAAAPLPPCDALRPVAVPADASLVLVLNDAMRRDRISTYGGPAQMPRLDAFAARNLSFRSASSAAPWTKPAIASLFTSRHPSQHGVLTHPGAAWSQAATPETDALPDELDTLAEVLRGHGFRTAAFVANPWLEEGFGFEQGFETWDASFAGWEAPGTDVVDAALAWLDGVEPHERFFLYLHTIDSHLPYGRLRAEDLAAERARPDPRPVPPEAERYLQGLRADDGRPLLVHDVPLTLGLLERAYDRGVEAFDAVFGRLLDAQAERPALARAALVVTSDHGEALFERGYGNHARALHAEELAIPLVARLPGVEPAAGAVDCPVALVDLMASFCHYLGVPCAPDLAGSSFLAGGPPAAPRYVVAEGVPRHPTHRSVRNARFKLVHAPGGPNVGRRRSAERRPALPDALYDLEKDPAETRDLLSARVPGRDAKRVAETLREALDGAVAPLELRGRKVPVREQARERLRALGYLDE